MSICFDSTGRATAAIAIVSGESSASLPSGTAVFSSGGPRTGDSALKPDITAPGEGIVSTLIGSGSQGIALSGTSMATPLVAGTAALVLQATRGGSRRRSSRRSSTAATPTS